MFISLYRWFQAQLFVWFTVGCCHFLNCAGLYCTRFLTFGVKVWQCFGTFWTFYISIVIALEFYECFSTYNIYTLFNSFVIVSFFLSFWRELIVLPTLVSNAKNIFYDTDFNDFRTFHLCIDYCSFLKRLYDFSLPLHCTVIINSMSFHCYN